ncbi:hypothetical protein PNI0076_02328 [Streptococcus pneumoniae PNI0076]|nr:hypothetical protein PNI0076_02328 [Streptococcus pneumoniae PNI0076]
MTLSEFGNNIQAHFFSDCKQFINKIYTLRKSFQTTSASPCRRYMILTLSVLSTTSKQCFEQPAASFLVCSLIFIEYK